MERIERLADDVALGDEHLQTTAENRSGSLRDTAQKHREVLVLMDLEERPAKRLPEMLGVPPEQYTAAYTMREEPLAKGLKRHHNVPARTPPRRLGEQMSRWTLWLASSDPTKNEVRHVATVLPEEILHVCRESTSPTTFECLRIEQLGQPADPQASHGRHLKTARRFILSRLNPVSPPNLPSRKTLGDYGRNWANGRGLPCCFSSQSPLPSRHLSPTGCHRSGLVQRLASTPAPRWPLAHPSKWMRLQPFE